MATLPYFRPEHQRMAWSRCAVKHQRIIMGASLRARSFRGSCYTANYVNAVCNDPQDRIITAFRGSLQRIITAVTILNRVNRVRNAIKAFIQDKNPTSYPAYPLFPRPPVRVGEWRPNIYF